MHCKYKWELNSEVNVCVRACVFCYCCLVEESKYDMILEASEILLNINVTS